MPEDNVETAAKKPMEYFEPRKHFLFNIYQFQQLSQEKEECYDNYATRGIIEAGSSSL